MTDLGCPKSMTFGPCGGVRIDKSCEVDSRPCPFLHDATDVPAPPSLDALRLPVSFPVIVVDVRAPLMWNGDVRQLWHRAGENLQGCVALLGEHVDNPPTEDDSGALDAAVVIELLGEAGVPAIVTVTGRDRDLKGARDRINAYRRAGAIAIHCVTGDHPAAVGIDRTARFGCESMTLIAEAVRADIAATVAESPVSPGNRVERLRSKATAGAAACILNHHGSAEEMIEFADTCRAGGVALPLIAPVPMIGDAASAQALARFPGLRLEPGLLHRVVTAADPTAEGRAAALSISATLARSGRFAGVNLSGSTGASDPWERLRLTAELARRIRDTWA